MGPADALTPDVGLDGRDVRALLRQLGEQTPEMPRDARRARRARRARWQTLDPHRERTAPAGSPGGPGTAVCEGDRVEASDEVGVSESFTLSIRGYFSKEHLWSAQHHARLAHELEAAHTGDLLFSIRHRAYVLSAVSEAVAFLDTFINELLQDAKDALQPVPVSGARQGLYGLPDDVVRLMAAYWTGTDEGERVRTIDKYDAARLFAGCPRTDRGRLPDQDVPRIIKLRNWSVHSRPQSYSHDVPDPRCRIEDARSRIDNPPNAFMASAGNPWFPDHALGAGCARWAVSTVQAFVDEFVAATGCRAEYRDITRLYGEQS